MQKVFEITNRNSILLTPLILFSLFSTIYLVVMMSGGKIINLLFGILVFGLMFSAFLSGWFNMVKNVVEHPDEDDSLSIMKDFSTGVGEYFYTTTKALVLVILFFIGMSIFTYFIGMHFIGDLGISSNALSESLKNIEALKSFLLSLSQDQLMKLNLWNILIMGIMFVSYLHLILYLPALFFENKNPFETFITALKNLYSNKFFITFLIFLAIVIFNGILSILSTLFTTNILLHFVVTLLNFYFITLASVGLFYYYHKSFITPMIGQNVDIEI